MFDIHTVFAKDGKCLTGEDNKNKNMHSHANLKLTRKQIREVIAMSNCLRFILSTELCQT